MIRLLDCQNEITNKQILELQLSSYRVEAELINYYNIPPLLDTTHSLANSGETFYGFYENQVLAGIISFKTENQVLDIHRLAVHPVFFRQGIARKLLRFVEISFEKITSIKVSTGLNNFPAIKLYTNNAYSETGIFEVEPGLFIASFKKTIR